MGSGYGPVGIVVTSNNKDLRSNQVISKFNLQSTVSTWPLNLFSHKSFLLMTWNNLSERIISALKSYARLIFF